MDGRPILYFPEINMGNYGTYGVGSAWWQIPEGYSLHARFNKYLQQHSIKSGSEVRIKRGEAARFRFFNFAVNANATANTTASPNLNQVGHPWASFLLGALDNSSSAQYVPMQTSDTEMYALYLQDDFRIHEKRDAEPRPSMGVRGRSLRSGIPASARSRSDAADSRPAGGHRSAHSRQRQGDDGGVGRAEELPLQRRVLLHRRREPAERQVSRPAVDATHRPGVERRPKTAVRAGYGRFYTPQMLVNENATMGQLDLGAFSPLTPIMPAAQGVPQVTLSNPFPQGLTPAYGKRYGTYTVSATTCGGTSISQRPAISDRFSFSVQRELWARTILDASYLMNFIGRDGYTKNLNMMDPRLSFKYGAALSATVPNPFFNYGTVDTFPGALRTRPTVARVRSAEAVSAVSQHVPGLDQRAQGAYHTLELRAQRPFYQRHVGARRATRTCAASRQEFYDNVDEYDERVDVDGRARIRAIA